MPKVSFWLLGNVLFNKTKTDNKTALSTHEQLNVTLAVVCVLVYWSNIHRILKTYYLYFWSFTVGTSIYFYIRCLTCSLFMCFVFTPVSPQDSSESYNLRMVKKQSHVGIWLHGNNMCLWYQSNIVRQGKWGNLSVQIFHFTSQLRVPSCVVISPISTASECCLTT